MEAILFYIDGCEHCKEYMKILEKFNFKLQFLNQIQLVECSLFFDRGIVDNPILLKYKKHLTGDFPTFVYKEDNSNDGIKFIGARDSEILYEFLLGLLNKKMDMKEPNNYLFNKKCTFTKKGFGSKVICE